MQIQKSAQREKKRRKEEEEKKKKGMTLNLENRLHMHIDILPGNLPGTPVLQ